MHIFISLQGSSILQYIKIKNLKKFTSDTLDKE